MRNYTAVDWVLIITTIFSGITGIIAAIKSNRASKNTDESSKTLTEIHKQTNGNLSEMKLKIEQVEAQNARLQRLAQELANAAPAGALAEIKRQLDNGRVDDK